MTKCKQWSGAWNMNILVTVAVFFWKAWQYFLGCNPVSSIDGDTTEQVGHSYSVSTVTLLGPPITDHCPLTIFLCSSYEKKHEHENQPFCFYGDKSNATDWSTNCWDMSLTQVIMINYKRLKLWYSTVIINR